MSKKENKKPNKNANKNLNKNEPGYFDKPENKTILAVIFICTLVALLVSDFFIHKHAYFSVGEVPLFLAFFGFVGCALLIVVAKQLRLFLKRGEDYYD